MESVYINKLNSAKEVLSGREPTEGHYLDVSKLPQVANGTVAIDDAEQWLETISKLYPEKLVNTLINQCNGFGAKDIRTLIAHDRSEYYPSDSAGEVFDKKLLKSAPLLNTPQHEEERILTNLARNVLTSKYQLLRDVTNENNMAIGVRDGKHPWLQGRPGLLAKNGDDHFLFHIIVSHKPIDVSTGDQINLHYYDLVANSAGIEPKGIMLANLVIDKNLANSLVQLSHVSTESKNLISSISREIGQNQTDGIDLVVHTVEKKPELYAEIVQSGDMHWANLVKGNEPKITEDPALILSETDMIEYEEKAKAFLVADQTRKASEELEKAHKSDFSQLIKKFNIDENFSPMYTGATFRKYDNFDKEQAAKYLEKEFQIDPTYLRGKEIDQKTLVEDYKALGGNIKEHLIHGDPDRKKIEDVAQQLGVSLESFYDREIRPIVPPKTRGPFYESVVDIRECAKESVETTIGTISNSDLVDAEPFVNSAESQDKPKASRRQSLR